MSDYKNWRERDKGDIPNLKKALQHLRNDRWSSYRDYCGIPNFPSILTKTLFEEHEGEYKDSLMEYLKDKSFQSLDSTLFE